MLFFFFFKSIASAVSEMILRRRVGRDLGSPQLDIKRGYWVMGQQEKSQNKGQASKREMEVFLVEPFWNQFQSEVRRKWREARMEVRGVHQVIYWYLCKWEWKERWVGIGITDPLEKSMFCLHCIKNSDAVKALDMVIFHSQI